MERVFGFYIHYRANGLPFYVGKGLPDRARLLSRPDNQYYTHIVNKDGKENIRILFNPCLSEQEALEKEVQLIAIYKRLGLELANHTDGGESPNHLPETKAKISAALKKARKDPSKKDNWRPCNNAAQRAHASAMGKALKGIPLSPEHRAKISAKAMGNKHSLGHYHSVQTKAKMSASKKVLYQDPDLRKAMGERRKGTKHSEETKRKIGAAHKALWKDEAYAIGHIISAETKAKIGAKSKALWATPGYRQKVLAAITGRKKVKKLLER